MSLGVFSFDLARLIESLYDLIDQPVQQTTADSLDSLDRTEDLLKEAQLAGLTRSDEVMAAALAATVETVLEAKEKLENSPNPGSSPAQPVRNGPPLLDEETRQEIERLIRSLQTTVVHNYRSSDIIDETVSHNNVANYANRRDAPDRDERSNRRREERRLDEAKAQLLRDDLKRAQMRHQLEA